MSGTDNTMPWQLAGDDLSRPGFIVHSCLGDRSNCDYTPRNGVNSYRSESKSGGRCCRCVRMVYKHGGSSHHENISHSLRRLYFERIERRRVENELADLGQLFRGSGGLSEEDCDFDPDKRHIMMKDRLLRKNCILSRKDFRRQEGRRRRRQSKRNTS